MSDYIRKHLAEKKARRITIIGVVLSILLHLLIFSAAFYYAKMMERKDQELLAEKPVMVEMMDKVPGEQTEGRVITQPLPSNEQIPEKSEVLAQQNNNAEKETHLANVPFNEYEGRGGPKGPQTGPGKLPGKSGTGKGGNSRDEILANMPAPGEGLEPGGGRKLPTSEELLKSAASSPGGGGGDGKAPFNPNRGEAGNAVSLNTREFKYISYFAHLKEKIEWAWIYPQEAQMQGQQGMLTLSFTIAKSGKLLDVRLLRTSGFYLLDDAAIKAVRDAADFKPMPSNWEENELTIVARFSYQLIGSKYVY